MARDPILQDILTELRGQRDIVTQLRVEFATVSRGLLELQNLPARVLELEKKQLTQEAFLRGGWWLWTKLVGGASLVAGAVAWMLNWFFPHA